MEEIIGFISFYGENTIASLFFHWRQQHGFSTKIEIYERGNNRSAIHEEDYGLFDTIAFSYARIYYCSSILYYAVAFFCKLPNSRNLARYGHIFQLGKNCRKGVLAII
jgi:hypothetical protein